MNIEKGTKVWIDVENSDLVGGTIQVPDNGVYVKHHSLEDNSLIAFGDDEWWVENENIHPTSCGKSHKPLYNQNKEEYFCPWCDEEE